MAYLKHLKDYVLVDLDSGTILGNPARVVLVQDGDLPQEDASDSEIIAVAEELGLTLPEFYYSNED